MMLLLRRNVPSTRIVPWVLSQPLNNCLSELVAWMALGNLQQQHQNMDAKERVSSDHVHNS